MTIAICFFGITRSLPYTISSIEKNILKPARDLTETKVYSHFFNLVEVENERSREKGRFGEDDHLLLPNTWLCLEQPDACLQLYDFEKLKEWGDSWNDGFKSLRNLAHQLHSLKMVTEAALSDGADRILFCRPDLYYHDSLYDPLKNSLSINRPTAFIPNWETHEGQNDRFSLCVGKAAIIAYGQRVNHMHEFCLNTYRPLHSERLLSFSLARAGINIRKIDQRASRIRVGGVRNHEDFSNTRFRKIKRSRTANFVRSVVFRFRAKKTRQNTLFPDD
jgi:hypothetical protein